MVKKINDMFIRLQNSITNWNNMLNKIDIIKNVKSNLNFNKNIFEDFSRNLYKKDQYSNELKLNKDFKFTKLKRIPQLRDSLAEELKIEYKAIRSYRLDMLEKFDYIFKTLNNLNFKKIKNDLSIFRKTIDKLFHYILDYYKIIMEYEKSDQRISNAELVTTEISDIFLDFYSLYESCANEFCINLNLKKLADLKPELNHIDNFDINVIYEWLDSHTGKNGYYELEYKDKQITFVHHNLNKSELFKELKDQITNLRNFLVHGGKSTETNSFINFKYIIDFILILICEIWYLIDNLK